MRALAPFRGGKRLPSAERGLGGGVFVGAMRLERNGTVSKGLAPAVAGVGPGRRALGSQDTSPRRTPAAQGRLVRSLLVPGAGHWALLAACRF